MRKPLTTYQLLPLSFFNRDPQRVAVDLLGKVLCHRVRGQWLMASLVETEAYYLADKASHASLGFTEKRRALFMPPGTIYMYYARGGDSFNVSCRGPGNAVLFKAGLPYVDPPGVGETMLGAMQRLNPLPNGITRAAGRLCAGQTLLCRSLGLRVPVWDARPILSDSLHVLDVGYRPPQIVRALRRGIPEGRDGHLPYRFVDAVRAGAATQNPLGRHGHPKEEATLHPYPRNTAAWRALTSIGHKV
ncbi:MAG TPA: DNA-3-methyladenine glycosylase [bacterium]